MMIAKRNRYLFLIFLLGLYSGVLFPQTSINLPTFSKDSFKRHLNFLGSDLFEGRGTGTTGGNLAAKYLALEFDNIKLVPLGNNNSYYQYIPIHGSKPLPSCRLSLYIGKEAINLKLFDDYLLYQSGEHTYIPNPVPLEFVGYGITAPEFDYNDYENLNVEGKIVVFWDGEPASSDPAFFGGESNTIYSYPESKQRIALSRGARGSILIPNAGSGINWENEKLNFSFENLALAYSVTSHFSIKINPGTAERLFDGAKYNLGDVIEFHNAGRMKSFPLNVKLSFKGDFKERDFVAANIIGMYPGIDPKLKERYIIISAHYDHLGIGPAVKGDSIYNGVFDNAAGAAALIELAKVFQQNNIKLKRSLIFLLVTGEEQGLLGSTYYTDNPVVPLYKTVANINIDGIALTDKFKSIVGIGKEFSTLEDYLEKTAGKLNLKIEPIPPQFKQFESFSKSDQMAFALAGIPAIMLYEGTEYENMSRDEAIKNLIDYAANRYHTPFDDLNQKINLDAAEQHLQLLYAFIYELANSDEEPVWKKDSPFLNARLRSIAEKK